MIKIQTLNFTTITHKLSEFKILLDFEDKNHFL